MAKSPKKGISSPSKNYKSTTTTTIVSPPKKTSSSAPPSSYAGKNLKSYQHHNFNNNSTKLRRFSIADSTSSSSSSDSDRKYAAVGHKMYTIDSSGSESELSAVSENDEDKYSKQFEKSILYGSNKNGRKTIGKKLKHSNSYSKKRTPKKTVDWSAYQDSIEDEYSDEDLLHSQQGDGEDEDDEEEDDDEEAVDHSLDNLYSMMHKRRKSTRVDGEEEEDDDEEEEDSEAYSSSDDDSEVDFVKLQAERKAKSMKAVRALKGLKKNSSDNHDQAIHSSSEEEDDDDEQSIEEEKFSKKAHRKSSFKFGARRSDAVLPEDINFTFEFGDTGKGFDSSSDIEGDSSIPEPQLEEEDIGEEVDYTPIIPTDDASSNLNNNFDFDFDNQLIQVPKINEEEINSDEDYEIDDNELLATLQAENDIDEFVNSADQPNNNRFNSLSRSNSVVSSIGDDDEEEFLKEEEKFLVNEFENNGFDEDGDDEFNITFDSDSSNRRLINSFKGIGEDRSKPIIQYESSVDADEDEDEDQEDEDEDDFIDFDVPLFDRSDDDEQHIVAKRSIIASSSHKKLNKKKQPVSNSDEDDDSYLWNYFFSSDNNSSSSDIELDDDDHTNLQELFKEIDNDKTFKSKKIIKENNIDYSDMEEDEIDDEDDEGYDSGESTDVDESLPKSSSNSQVGSKMAKEVLSSKTADYRPPVLGSWVTIDSKPFGIIDGMSTRSLNLTNKSNEPRTAVPTTNPTTNAITPNKKLLLQQSQHPQRPSTPSGIDDALGLDELLNISELDDDDENDVRIWRDFQKRKPVVPLGAFRNKSILLQNTTNNNNNHHPLIHHEVAQPFNGSNSRRFSSSGGSGGIKKSRSKDAESKLKRRRASIIEAVAEGFRPTKSGLFSENALADVEELLGEDHDLMTLIKGL
ncbi:IFH1 [[Candida] subhashii]|uniref:IFH1 n=1 Tax=[Candida] subhashii TaxID=561895 RepID=A0A8J5QQ35_9ASCO|nr:IFH1 [[Candida] subhashii]KAG7664373.1 IFH1 [[Candida] subhashii]